MAGQSCSITTLPPLTTLRIYIGKEGYMLDPAYMESGGKVEGWKGR